MSRFKVPLAEVDKVHVPLDEQVEEQEAVPPPPLLSEAAEREKANTRAAGGPV